MENKETTNPILHARSFFKSFNFAGFPICLNASGFAFFKRLVLHYVAAVLLSAVCPGVLILQMVDAAGGIDLDYLMSRTGLSALDSALLVIGATISYPMSVVIVVQLYKKTGDASKSFMAICQLSSSRKIEKSGERTKQLIRIWSILLIACILIINACKLKSTFQNYIIFNIKLVDYTFVALSVRYCSS